MHARRHPVDLATPAAALRRVIQLGDAASNTISAARDGIAAPL